MLDSKVSKNTETQSPFATSDRQDKVKCHFLTPEAEDRESSWYISIIDWNNHKKNSTVPYYFADSLLDLRKIYDTCIS